MIESCNNMGIENCVMVEFKGKPEPGTEENYASQLSSCKRVCWSVLGGGSYILNNHIKPVKTVLELSERYPNIRDVICDDFNPKRCTLEQLGEMRKLLKERERPFDMWVVVYDLALKNNNVPYEHLELFDVITYWTWNANDLDSLESNFKKLRSSIPGKRFILGCYMWDYGAGKPIPVNRMAEQCQIAIKLLKEGAIEGIIFLASCICDLKIDAVEWTRKWIAHVGNYNLQEINLDEINSWTKKSLEVVKS
jgi:hypothetical protein